MEKVLIFSTAYDPFIGGAEVAVKEITNRINDIQFDMITARMNRKLAKTECIGNINVYRIGFGLPTVDKYLLAFWGHWFAQKLNKKNNYNVIWSIMASYGGFAAMFFKKNNKNIPFLLTLQEGDSFEYINKRVSFLKNKFKDIFISANCIQCISNYLANWAKEMGAKCPVEVIPNGVDIEKFRISNFEFRINDIRKNLDIKDDEKVVVTTSRLVIKNGIDDLIKAMKEIDAKLIICGDGEEKEKLEKLAEELNINNKIIFFGSIKHDELPKYLWASDVFCRPSLSEGLGNSFLEAMAAGIPVIATPVGGIPDFLREGETGWFCEVRDPESIAGKIRYIINKDNEEKQKKIIENARVMVTENYNWDKISEDMKDIFNKI